MPTINIALDFSPETGFRTYEDGPFSGQEFFEKMLKSAFIAAEKDDEKLEIVLYGGEGYTSSFLNEAFRLLGKEFGADNVWGRLEIVSNEIPKYVYKIKESVYEDE